MFRAPTWKMSEYLADQLDLADVHDLGDELQVVRIGCAPEHLKPLLAQALEAVRRAARLEGASAQNLGAGALDGRRACHDLLFGFRRARPGHDDHLVTAYPHVVEDDHGVFRLVGAARALVGLADPQHFVHAVEDADQLGIDFVRTDDTQNGAGRSRRPMHVHPQFDQACDHRVDLNLGGPLFHDDDHNYSPIRESGPSL